LLHNTLLDHRGVHSPWKKVTAAISCELWARAWQAARRRSTREQHGAVGRFRAATIFLRLGACMLGPQGIPVGALRRVFISNIVCSNSDSCYGSIISGIPGRAIADGKTSDLYIQHQGGATSETAALQPADLENSYPDPKMFGKMPHKDSSFATSRIEMNNVEISSLQADARPAFILDDVQGARSSAFAGRTQRVYRGSCSTTWRTSKSI
jgi:hypothetical protein